MKPETKLARIFLTIADEESRTESTAGGILSIVTEARVRDVEAFNPLVTAAYAANGWNARPGRPDTDAEEKGEVPATVRTYVTTIRRGFRAGIRVASMKTFYQLRKALRKAAEKKHGRRRAQARIPEEIKMNFVGVNVQAANDMNGALIHDTATVYAHLPEEQRTLFEKQLKRLLQRYVQHAEGITHALPEKIERAA